MRSSEARRARCSTRQRLRLPRLGIHWWLGSGGISLDPSRRGANGLLDDGAIARIELRWIGLWRRRGLSGPAVCLLWPISRGIVVRILDVGIVDVNGCLHYSLDDVGVVHLEEFAKLLIEANHGIV